MDKILTDLDPLIDIQLFGEILSEKMCTRLFLTLWLSKILLLLSFSTPKHTYKASRAILSNFVEEL